MGSIVVVTGTDTGVGKTCFTALSVAYLRGRGQHTLAMKPFCSGGRQDARVLFRASGAEVPLDEMNPFFFEEPLAPLIAARREGKRVPALVEVIERVQTLAQKCELLLVEGAGGLLVPLGQDFTAAELIGRLRCPVVLVVRNQLGAINHTLLTLRVLRCLEVQVRIVLAERHRKPDLAARTNGEMLRKWCAPSEVFQMPFLGKNPTNLRALKNNVKKMKKTLAEIFSLAMFSPASSIVRKSDTEKVKKKALAKLRKGDKL